MTKAQINARVLALFATDVNFPGSLGSKRGAVAFKSGKSPVKPMTKSAPSGARRSSQLKVRRKRSAAAVKA
jgi:hypothetical protein